MSIQRVAVIYDDSDRPDTTGNYCLRALSQLVHAEHFRPCQFGEIPRSGFDLYLNVDDSFPYLLPTDLRPAAFWAIDTHLAFERELAKAQAVDFTFAAQKDGAQDLAAQGIKEVSWLPLACDAQLHCKQDVLKEFDFAFVGNSGSVERRQLLELLQNHFPRQFVGNAYFEEMARIYSASRIVFNCSVRNDINMRVFEALGCGSLLMTNDLSENGLAELFRDGIHLATYRQTEELLDKLRYYLKHEEVRERIAAAGHAAVLNGHTYLDRMRTLLRYVASKIKTSLAVAVVGQSADSPCNQAGSTPKSKPVPLPPSKARIWQELVAEIPTSAERVLLIGDGASWASGLLGPNQRTSADCIEPTKGGPPSDSHPFASLILGKVGVAPDPLHSCQFDAIGCLHSLERAPYPLTVLRRLHQMLSSSGQLIVGFANARQRGKIQALSDGNWNNAHRSAHAFPVVQQFTHFEIDRLLYRGGFEPAKCIAVRTADEPNWSGNLSRAEPLCRLQPTDAFASEAEELSIGEFVVRATRVERPQYGLTSIIILTHNLCDMTRQCVDSLLRSTDPPFELIFVDNGSTDSTVEYLRTIPNARIITNRENRGFPAGANQGIRAATGENFLLLNNDTTLTFGWLDRMLEALYSDPQIGIVGPCISWPECPQQVAGGYQDDAELERFAWRHSRQYNQAREEVEEIVGCCLLFKRAVFDAIGLLDEGFGVGECEDKDYCMRARKAGYRLLIARDVFVRHFGHRTFVENGIGNQYSSNVRRFREKWGRPVT